MSANAIPGYILKKKLGAGAMASVFLARDEKLHRDVALKVMSKKLLADPTFVDRFQREARIVAGFSHRNIVTVFDVGSHNNFHYMAMELLPGGDLSAKLKNGLALEQGIAHIIEIAEGLQYASSKNFIHRDIKPDNIMFAEDGRAVITDFGIARDASSESNMTMAGTVIGTPQYMSPEQAGGKTVDHRTDLYSLGIILYQMLAGKTPFKGDSAISTVVMHINEPVPPLPEKYSHFQNFIDIALAKNPDDRFQSGNDFIKALSRIRLDNDADNSAATLIFGSEAGGSTQTGLKSGEVMDFLSDLSDEFLSTTNDNSLNSETVPASDVNNVAPEVVAIVTKPKAPSSTTQNLTMTDMEEKQIRERSSSQKIPEIKTPLLTKKIKLLLILLLIMFGTIGGHIYYVNVLGKQIHFEALAKNMAELSHKLSGKERDFTGFARFLNKTSAGLGKLSGTLLGGIIPMRVSASHYAEQKYIDLINIAMAEGRLYAPRFDCAEIYLMELARINPQSKMLARKANELMRLSVNGVQSLSASGQHDEARQLVADANRILPLVDDRMLQKQYSQLAASLEQ